MGDFHGTDPIPFIKKCKRKGIEKLVCLGDYDDPAILENILALDMDKIVLIGNHDYHLVVDWYKDEADRFYLKSGYLPDMFSMEYDVLMKKWHDNKTARDFVLKSKEVRSGRKKGLRVVGKVDDKKVIYTHASLVDHKCKYEPYQLWQRITPDDSMRANFKEMRRLGYWIMFRAHDHFPLITYMKNGINVFEHDIHLAWDNKVKLKNDELYIVTVGSFREGRYVVLDDEKRTVKLKDIND